MIIGSFSAASNVSGIVENDLEITQLLHNFWVVPGGGTVLFAFGTKLNMMNRNIIKILKKENKVIHLILLDSHVLRITNAYFLI